MDFIFNYFMENPELIVVLCVLAFVTIYKKKDKQKRIEKISKYGFEIVSAAEFKQWAKIERFNNLKKESLVRELKEPMRGSFQGYQFGLFMHWVRDGSELGKSQTAVLMKTNTQLPDFILRPERMRFWGDRLKGKLMGKFGFDKDIDFPGFEVFSKKIFS